MADLQLESGEIVAWSGQPAPWRYAIESLPRVKIGVLFFAGGIFFSAFAFGIESAANQVWPCLVPLLASAGGVAMMSVFPLRYRRAKQLAYYITNERAIIYDKRAQTVQDSFCFGSSPAPCVFNYPDGTCDIVFHVESPPRLDETELEHSARVVRHGLIAIEDGSTCADWLAEHIEACRSKP